MKQGNIPTNNTDTSKADEKYMSAALAQSIQNKRSSNRLRDCP